MRVLTRNGQLEEVDFNKITHRLQNLSHDLKNVDPIQVAKKICDSIYDKVTTVLLDDLSAEISITLSTTHPEYGILASKIEASNLQKKTHGNFESVTNALNETGILNESYTNFVIQNISEITDTIDYSKDYNIDYFGLKTLQKAYLFKDPKGNIIERPQDMWMRVSLAIHCGNIKSALQTYEYMSDKYFTHATPTLYNAGTKWQQLSSCYLLELEEDSIQGIYNTLADCAQISKWAGGIGIHIHNLRATGADIRKNKGVCSGIVPALRVFNATSRYVNQGGKRPGSIAIYLSVDHPDVSKFLDLKKNTGDEEERCRDLFYALWIPDLFMKRVKENGKWSLFCPHKVPGLSDVYSEEYENIYLEAENNKLYNEQVDAQKLWFSICNSQIETGTPYILYKDHVNRKSNQMNVGTIKSSNLCVHPDTKVLTDNGEVVIGEYENQSINVWNGKRFSNVVVKKTGENVNLNKIHFNLKTSITCTPEHKFHKQLHNIDTTIEIPCNELKVGDEMMHFRMPDGRLVKPIVTRIEHNVETSDTYCFTEPFEHKAVFNGVLTGQCTEIMEYTSPEETAVCNLASISLPMFVKNQTFDFEKLHEITKVITINLNKVIDINFYPTEKAERSNFRHRPIGIGVQGLADTYILMRFPFDSEEASELNKKIFEVIYHASLEASLELAKTYGPYETFDGSPASQGNLQFDLWNHSGHLYYTKQIWDKLKSKITQYGIRNSLLIAPMPTASTSQILGNNECIEPYTSNIYLRRTLAGEFVVVNKHMINDLIKQDLWNEDLRDEIIFNNGSIQNIYSIPQDLKNLYKTAWELKQKVLINQAADRGVYVCQSQSLNLFVAKPDLKTLSSMHFYSWNKGLKTGMYYLRTQPAANPIQFTINPDICTTCSA